MILSDIAVGAGVECGDGGVQGGECGHQHEKGIRGNFFGEFQQVDAIFPRHTNVGNDDVEDLRFQLAFGGLGTVRDFHPMTFLAKSDL